MYEQCELALAQPALVSVVLMDVRAPWGGSVSSGGADVSDGVGHLSSTLAIASIDI